MRLWLGRLKSIQNKVDITHVTMHMCTQILQKYTFFFEWQQVLKYLWNKLEVLMEYSGQFFYFLKIKFFNNFLIGISMIFFLTHLW